MIRRKPQYYIYRVKLLIISPFIQFFCQIKLLYWGVLIGKQVRFLGNISVRNLNKISIGDHTRILSGRRNLVGADIRTSFETGQNGEIIIGRNVGISNSVFISQSKIQIGDFVYIGGGTRIYDNDFHSIDKKTRLLDPLNIPTSPVEICEGAFIGGHCIILKGVRIGKNSVVGAGSVVTKSIPDNEIWAGVPAKKLRCL